MRLYIKLMTKIIAYLLLLMIIRTSIVIYKDYTHFYMCMAYMDKLVTSSFTYSTKAIQDIDAFNNRVFNSPNTKVLSEYNDWVDAMSKYSIVDCKNGYGNKLEKQQKPDEVFISMMEELKEGKSQTYRISPLNFGVTYLNAELLEDDMEYYIKSMLNKRYGYLSKNVYYDTAIRSDNIRVDAEIVSTPVNISLIDNEETRYMYKQLFGVEKILSDDYQNDSLKVSDNLTIVKTEIKVKVYYEIVPLGFYFNLNSKSKEYNSYDKKPDGIFFPYWDTGTNKTANARYTLVRDGVEYRYDYLILN